MTQTPLQRPCRSTASRRPAQVVLPVHDPVVVTNAVACDSVPEGPDSAIWTYLPLTLPMDLLPSIRSTLASGSVRTEVIRGSGIPARVWDHARCSDCTDARPDLAERGRSASHAVLIHSRGDPATGRSTSGPVWPRPER